LSGRLDFEVLRIAFDLEQPGAAAAGVVLANTLLDLTVLSDCGESSMAALTDSQQLVLLQINRGIISNFTLQYCIFTIFDIEKLHLDAIQNVNVAIIDDHEKVQAVLALQETDRLDVLVELRLHDVPRELEVL